MRENKDNIVNYKFMGTGLSKNDKKSAKNRFDKYRKHYNIDNYSDLCILEELVFRENLQEGSKKKIELLTKNKSVKDAQILPKGLLDTIDKNEECMLILREKLGLFSEKIIDDAYEQHEILEKKMAIYRAEHPMEFETKCPFCEEIYFLKRRTKDFEPLKLKLFKNGVLVNSEMWKWYKEGKITKDEFAKALNVSPDQIQWLAEHIYNTPAE